MPPKERIHPRAKEMSERQLTKLCIELINRLGMWVNHNETSRAKSGAWATALLGNNGAPDLNPIVGYGILHAELKSETGRQSPEQIEWERRITAAGGLYVIWKPRDWYSGRIERELRALARPRLAPAPVRAAAPPPRQTLPPILGYAPSPTRHA